ncbi:MAG TPA: nuclear transport factor 2 family protein [Pyrinomonadaceae bacterium]|nr:nuclear transport factor 2 family protein [Pyrinomonadaceae bacterium]
MKSIFVATALLLTIASVVIGETAKKSEEELLKANREYDQALVRGDAVALDRLYSEEFVYTTPDGEVRNKAQQLAFTRSGDLRLEAGQSDEVKVRVYGNTAVMTGRFTAKGKLIDKNIDIRERYTAVWVKRSGRWRLVAEQGNLIKQQ